MRYQKGNAPEGGRRYRSRAYRYENSRPYSVFALALAAAAAAILVVGAISGALRAFDLEPKATGVWAAAAERSKEATEQTDASQVRSGGKLLAPGLSPI